MATTVSTKLTLDSSGFNKGIKSAESSVAKFKSSAGSAAVTGIAAGFAAAGAAAVAMAVGIKKALDIGGALSELSARTGVAAGDLRVLQMAFDRTGVGAEKVGPAINKMQKAIVEAGQGSKTAQDALGNLGLSVSQLSAMSPDQQFAAISKAIGGLSDPAKQATAAMQIFGKSGGEMLALFQDSGALGDAARAIGSQAALLTKNANMFDRASDILNTVGSKLEGFFVGVADQVVPAIMPLLEAADGIDFAGIGQGIGKGIAFGVTAITSGKLGELVAAQLKLSAAQFLNLLVQGLYGLMAFVAQRMIDIPGEFITLLSIVTKAEFWAGVGNGLIGAAEKFAALIQTAAASLLEAVSKVPGLGGAAGLAETYRASAADMNARSAARFSAAGDALSGPMQQAKDRIALSFNNAVTAMATAMQTAGDTVDTKPLEAARDQVVGAISAVMESNAADTRAKFSATKTVMPDMGDATEGTGKVNQGVIAQSVQAVGGGGLFSRFSDASNPAQAQLRESQKQTGLLQKIAEKLAPTQQPLMAY